MARALSLVEDRARPLADTLASFVSDRRMLLVFDNCEHVIDAAATLAEYLLQRAKDLRIVVTSREALRIAGETLYPVPSLALPDAEEAISITSSDRYPAIGLFVERALATLRRRTFTPSARVRYVGK